MSLAAGLALAACSGDEQTSDTTVAVTEPTTAPLPIATSPVGANDTAYPAEVVDCDGRTTTFEQAPERVVALDESVVETLVLLGLGDTIVGVTRDGSDDDLWTATRDALLSRQVVNEGTAPATREAIERVGPDLVVASDPTRLLAPSAVTTREQWTEAGVRTHLGRAGCDPATPSTDGLALFYDDLRAFGTIFDAQLRAEKIVSQVQATVQRLAGDAARVGAVDRTVWVYGGEGVVFDRSSTVDGILRAAGVTVVEAAPDELAAVAAADPDVIWLITPRGADAESTGAALRAELESDPTLASVRAVVDGRFVVTPFSQVAPSPRLVEGMQALVTALAEA